MIEQQSHSSCIKKIVFVFLIFSGVIWLKYSIMVSSVQYGVANFVNTVLQASYIVIFHSYTKDKVSLCKVL